MYGSVDSSKFVYNLIHDNDNSLLYNDYYIRISFVLKLICDIILYIFITVIPSEAILTYLILR